MKKLVLLSIVVAGFISLSACETEDHHRSPEVQSTTTTTEESTVRRPVSSTTETQSVRTY